jgi:hypothetical protein
MSVSCECCILSGRGLCNVLIPRPEESYQLCCVIMCDTETSLTRVPWPVLGLLFQKKECCFLRSILACVAFGASSLLPTEEQF